MQRSPFLRPMHPKTEIRPTPEAISKILGAGWVGQLKIHGHRAQIHIPADSDEEIVAYNRQGRIHKKEIPDGILSELRRIFAPSSSTRNGPKWNVPGWNVIDAEWIKNPSLLSNSNKEPSKAPIKLPKKDNDKLYVFDILKQEGELLNRLTFQERWKLLPRAYISPCIQTLGLLTNLSQCLKALERQDDFIEGLVFKSPSPGFQDSSIIRCRRLPRP